MSSQLNKKKQPVEQALQQVKIRLDASDGVMNFRPECCLVCSAGVSKALQYFVPQLKVENGGYQQVMRSV